MTYCWNGGLQMKHMVDYTHPPGKLEQWGNLKIDGDLERVEMFLVVVFYYTPDHDLYHFGRNPAVGGREAQGKMVVGHALDCRTH
jgi:hypothetical protein